MDSKLNFRRIMSVMLICFVATAFGQEMKKKNSVGDAVYDEYKQNGIDKALAKYRDLKANKDYEVNEWELNRIGYQIMQEDGDLETAEKIFKVNLQEYPEAANPMDSYADYLIEKGNPEEARKYLEKSIAQNEKNKKEDEKQLLKSSKAKLAKLENKHKQLDFLVGNWEVESTSFEGMGAGNYSGTDEYVQDESADMVVVNHKNPMGNVMAKRIMVYDAVNDEYDVAYIDTNAPMGIELSTLKLKDLGNGNYELMEEYVDEQGKNKKNKHEIKRTGNNEVDWVIFQAGENQDWKKVYAMDMTKKQ